MVKSLFSPIVKRAPSAERKDAGIVPRHGAQDVLVVHGVHRAAHRRGQPRQGLDDHSMQGVVEAHAALPEYLHHAAVGIGVLILSRRRIAVFPAGRDLFNKAQLLDIPGDRRLCADHPACLQRLQ